MAKNGSLKCEKCNRHFSLPAHLARHMSAIHGAGGRRKRKAGRKVRMHGRRGRIGRPKAIISGLRLDEMSLDQIMEVISVAKNEARNRLDRLQMALS